ncbi:MAG: tyrosine-type recombinase/integrase [Eubacteriales bacterium]|nr:tyrosine-type recombinase/integrase [Eubacteriales bacterium]
MTEEKQVKKKLHIQNKSDKPDNIVLKEHEIMEQCREIEENLPRFMRSYFSYLRSNVLPMTRLAYLRDLRFFCEYLIKETGLVSAKLLNEITQAELDQIKASDINLFLDYCRRYVIESERSINVYQNENRSLARKKSSLSVFFKHLYREELIHKNITDAFDPIRVPKPGEREIKALQDDEVMKMLDAVTDGTNLTKREHEFWEKTKHRDKAILLLFLTYGLRLSELQQLNLSSFNFNRGEFKIYRKRGKESIMPLNKTAVKALEEYLSLERKNSDLLAETEKDALFLSLQGRRMTERQIRELVKKYTSIALSTSRAKGYSPHKLRATAATSLIGRGNSIYDVQALLDHENVTTTQLYAAHKLNVKRDLIKNFEWDEENEKEKE